MKVKKDRGPTAFEERVYEATRRIPRGSVTTYKRLAEEVGCGSSRAVGQALARNPYAPVVPCHRVIRSDMKAGGFSGHKAGPVIRKKIKLLEGEGVRFNRDGKLLEPERVFRFRGK